MNQDVGPFLVVGLGNPGPKYANHRHNIGFMTIDRLAHRAGLSSFREKFKGLTTKRVGAGPDLILLKPQTYMNLSGDSVQRAMRFFRVPIERILVVHDELDLPYETVRLKRGGGSAGHNGLKSITRQCGGPDYCRLRVGIGRPEGQRVESYVLSDFSQIDKSRLPDVVDLAVDMVESWVRDGVDATMNRYHVRT